MTSLWAIMTNGILLEGFAHVISAAIVTAGMLVLAIAAYHLIRKREVELFAHAAQLSLVVLLIGGAATIGWGHFQGQLLVREQPMKMAAAEALFTTEKPASVSLFAITPWSNPTKNDFNITVPHLLSFLNDWHWNSKAVGMNELQAQYAAKYGAGSYKPNVPVSYWSFRIMTGLGFFFAGWAALGLFLMRKRRLESTRLYLLASIPLVALPFVANTTGWLLTEMGRQPWIVQGLFKTSDAFSHSVSAGSVVFTLAGFILVYSVLAAVETGLVLHIVKAGPAPLAEAGAEDAAKPQRMGY
jgi:cytochrome d ubiquinol oxidase subunit I